LLVDGELAEAVAEVLARYVSDGVVIESTAIIPDPDGEGRPADTLRVCGYLPVDKHLEETRQKVEQALWYLGRISPLPEAEFKPMAEINWVDAWKEHYHPIPIGEKLMVVPAWLIPPGEARLSIMIDPGMAFGTGTHPTTQLCLSAAETWTMPGQPVIDIGCGSGILSIAALKLGASQALAVDLDAQAIQATLENARANQVADQIETGIGSAAEVKAGAFSLRHAPLVFANILAHIILRLLDDGLADLITPGGVAVLSGILAEQENSVLEALQQKNLRLQSRQQMGDWVALVITP
jgi:ribosomal protein L11 methyltransferase